MVPSSQAYLLKFQRTTSMYCHKAITSDILTSTHANCVVLKLHTCMPVAETQDLQACVFVTSHHVCYNYAITGMLGTHVLDQCACLLYLYQTSNPTIIATGSVDIFTISMFD